MSELAKGYLEEALTLLSERLAFAGAQPYQLLVCGGAALIIQEHQIRTTKDVDILCLVNASGELVNPAPLPAELVNQIEEVALDLKLPSDWMNNEPSRDEGGLFQVGLPEGLMSRAKRIDYGSHLAVWFTGRLDLIHFKLYASVDSGPGRHVEDMLALQPEAQEMLQASRWALEHDPSAGFVMMLKSMLDSLGFEDVASQL